MKVGIVVPFSWSYLGGVGEHAEGQAQALEALGADVRVIIGDDPPGSVTRLFHPDAPRADPRPPGVLSVGTTVTVPANASRAHIVLSPLAVPRVRRLLKRERFDVLHLHEPMTPAICTAALAMARCPIVATWHATGELNWLKPARPAWGFLMDRIDHRIAVSEMARETANNHTPGDYEIIPNGTAMPEHAASGDRENTVVFIGRNDPRKGLEILLRAWPRIRAETGARLRVIGTEPQAVQLLIARRRLSAEGVDMLGVVVNEALTRELTTAKALVAPSLGGESFGMVLTRAFGCATPVVASAIPGYEQVMTPEVGLTVEPGDPAALAAALIDLLTDEPRRRRMGDAARARALEHYGWGRLATRLLRIYQDLTSPPDVTPSRTGPLAGAASTLHTIDDPITTKTPR